MTERTPYQEGYQAVRNEGRDLCDNPYKNGADAQKFKGWKLGANKALEEKNAEGRRRMDDAAAEQSRDLGRRGGL